jgi:hypothetical protein
MVLKDTPKAAPPTATKRPSEELNSDLETASRYPSSPSDGFFTDSSSNGQVHVVLNALSTKRHKGHDAAKLAEAKEAEKQAKLEALQELKATEKEKLKLIGNLKVQVRVQNMIAMLNHPSVMNNPALSEQMFTCIMNVINVDEREAIEVAPNCQVSLNCPVANNGNQCNNSDHNIDHSSDNSDSDSDLEDGGDGKNTSDNNNF